MAKPLRPRRREVKPAYCVGRGRHLIAGSEVLADQPYRAAQSPRWRPCSRRLHWQRRGGGGLDGHTGTDLANDMLAKDALLSRWEVTKDNQWGIHISRSVRCGQAHAGASALRLQLSPPKCGSLLVRRSWEEVPMIGSCGTRFYGPTANLVRCKSGAIRRPSPIGSRWSGSAPRAGRW